MDISSKKLTLLLPLFGRKEFTDRIFSFLSNIDSPAHLIIGDGKKNEYSSDRLHILDSSNNLTYEYLQFDDSSYQEYFKKLHQMSLAVKTEFCMLIDNDDFPLITGIIRCIDFLESHPEYAAAKGTIMGLNLKDSLPNGKFQSLKRLYSSNFSIELRDLDPNKRLLSAAEKLPAEFYNVTYPHIFQTIFQEAIDLGIKDLNIFEHYMIFRMHTFGKIKLINIPYYIRQFGTSSSAASLSPIHTRILSPEFNNDVTKVIKILSKAVQSPSFIDQFRSSYMRGLIAMTKVDLKLISKTELTDIKLLAKRLLSLLLKAWESLFFLAPQWLRIVYFIHIKKLLSAKEFYRINSHIK